MILLSDARSIMNGSSRADSQGLHQIGNLIQVVPLTIVCLLLLTIDGWRVDSRGVLHSANADRFDSEVA